MIATLRNTGLAGFAATAAVAAWLVAASALWCKGTGSPFRPPWLQWWNALACGAPTGGSTSG